MSPARTPHAAPDGGEPVAVALAVGAEAAPALASLASVAAQTHRRLELLVAAPDGGGDADRTVEALAPWLDANAGRFGRVALLRTPAVDGLAAQRNAAFAAAEARAVMVLDAGSTLLPIAVARLWDALETSGAACVYPQQLLLADGSLGTADVWRRDGFLQGDYVGSIALVRRDAWARAGGYTPVDGGWESYDFWCRFVEMDLQGVYVPNILARVQPRAPLTAQENLPEHECRPVHMMLSRHPWLELKV